MLRITISKLCYRKFNMKLMHSNMDIVESPVHFTSIKMHTFASRPLLCTQSLLEGAPPLPRLNAAEFCNIGDSDKQRPTSEVLTSGSPKTNPPQPKCCNETPTVTKIEDKPEMKKGFGEEKTGIKSRNTVADHQVNLPDKEQVEKYFFRVVAFIYDLTYLTLAWTAKNVDQHIVQNEMVQLYWKKFHEKMEKAKRD